MAQYMRWKIALVPVSLFVVAQAIHPVSPDPDPRPLTHVGAAPPQIVQILNRSCRDCHSMGTEWPWYARIAPVSWMVAHDVKKGRKFLNFSEWDSYSKGQKMAYLAAMGSATSQERMPPKRYLMVHPKAKLSAADRSLLKDWSKAEFRRVKSPLTQTRTDATQQPADTIAGM
jgi:hypothetical protein